MRPFLPKLWLESPGHIEDLRAAGVEIPSPAKLQVEMQELESGGLEQHPETLEPIIRFGALQSVYDGIGRLENLYDRDLKGLPAERRRLRIRTALQQWYFETMFRWSGSRVYVIDQFTLGLLAQTELPRMPADEFKLPLNSFYLLLPDGLFEFTEGPSQIAVRGVTVACADGAAGSGRSREMALWVDGIERGSEGNRFPSLAFLDTRLRLTADRTLEQVAHRRGDDRDRLATGVGAVALDSIAKVVVGLCLYLMSEHPHLEPVPPAIKAAHAGIKNPGKRRKAEQRDSRISRLGYIRVGDPLDRVGDPDDSSAASSPAGAWQLDHQVWVRGHWRLQAFGEALKDRRLIWIRPHTKGPDMADSVALRAARVQPARLKTVPDGRGERTETEGKGSRGPS